MAKKSTSAAAASVSSAPAVLGKLTFSEGTLSQSDLVTLGVSLREESLYTRLDQLNAKSGELGDAVQTKSRERETLVRDTVKKVHDELQKVADRLVDPVAVSTLIASLKAFHGMATAYSAVASTFEMSLHNRRTSAADFLKSVLAGETEFNPGAKIKIDVNVEVRTKVEGDGLTDTSKNLFGLNGFSRIILFSDLGIDSVVIDAIVQLADMTKDLEELSKEHNEVRQQIAQARIDLAQTARTERQAHAEIIKRRLADEAGGDELIEGLRRTLGAPQLPA
jgi:hypothetical protein